jgi:hypothetical protein
MAYYPANYPVLKIQDKASEPLVARVIYSRPQKNNRVVFGELVEYNQVWRMGANEATEIEFFQPVSIQEKRVGKGKYIMYTIPYQDKWTIVFNTNLNSWGLTPNAEDDVFKFDVPIQIASQSIEYFSMVFQATEAGADLVIAWDNIVARLPIQF